MSKIWVICSLLSLPVFIAGCDEVTLGESEKKPRSKDGPESSGGNGAKPGGGDKNNPELTDAQKQYFAQAEQERARLKAMTEDLEERRRRIESATRHKKDTPYTKPASDIEKKLKESQTKFEAEMEKRRVDWGEAGEKLDKAKAELQETEAKFKPLLDNIVHDEEVAKLKGIANGLFAKNKEAYLVNNLLSEIESYENLSNNFKDLFAKSNVEWKEEEKKLQELYQQIQSTYKKIKGSEI